MTTSGIHIRALADLEWRDVGRPGLSLAPVYEDREAGRFLGLLGFAPMTATGLHQHLDPAFSYFLDGGLTDYQGTATAGEVGINLAGATHDAIAYRRTTIAARLEGPVAYAHGANDLADRIHSGARSGDLKNPAPEILPDINVRLEDLPWGATQTAGVARRTVFDYAKTPHDRRFSQVRLLPETTVPMFRTADALDLFVMGGSLSLNGEPVGAGGFAVVDPETQVRMASDHGALLLAWSEAPIVWDDRETADLFGF